MFGWQVKKGTSWADHYQFYIQPVALISQGYAFTYPEFRYQPIASRIRSPHKRSELSLLNSGLRIESELDGSRRFSGTIVYHIIPSKIQSNMVKYIQPELIIIFGDSSFPTTTRTEFSRKRSMARNQSAIDLAKFFAYVLLGSSGGDHHLISGMSWP